MRLAFSVAIIFSVFLPKLSGAAPCTETGSGTVLERAANGLSPGEWCDFDQAEPSNFDIILGVAPGDINSVLEFSHGAQWDPVNRLWVFRGYGYSPIVAKMVVYKESTNTWYGFEGEPTAPGGNGHDYDQTAVDPETGYVYFRPRLTNTVWRAIWNDSINRYSWSNSAVARIGGSCPSQTSFEANGWAWDASRNGIVMLSQADDGVVCFWDRASNTWRRDANVNVTGNFHQVAEYDPKRQLVWMNDYTSTTHWKDEGGVVTRMNSTAPFGLGCCGNSGAMSTADPVTGNFIVTRTLNGGRVWWEYDVSTDRWAEITGSMPSVGDNASSLGGPVTDHGVIMYVSWLNGNPQIHLYRHAVSTAVPRPTVELVASSNSVLSGESVILSWNSSGASSCSASGDWSGVKALSGQQTVGPLNSSSTFFLNCSNADSTTSRSVSVEVTDPLPPPPNPSGDSGWGDRSSHRDVVYANRFDDYQTDFYNNLWPNPTESRRASEYDQNVKSSGAASLRFDFIPGGEGFGGELAISLGDDPADQFGAGDDFWVQWRQRFDPYVIDHQYAVTSGGGQWKQLIISQGQLPGQGRWETRSCSENEIVISNPKGRKYPQSYHGCWFYYAIESAHASGAISRMNYGDESGNPNAQSDTDVWPCQYWPFAAAEAGCKFYRPDQWMTFMVHVSLGPDGEARSSIGDGSIQRGFVDSTYELYVAYEGQSLELAHRKAGLVFRRGNYEDDPGSSSHQAKYGMFRWLPHISFKDGSESHTVASTWIDEIIISTSWINAPNVGPRPLPPSSLNVNE